MRRERADLSGIVMVAAGGESTNGRSMALAADGTIWVWGRNNEGQLGNGETASVTVLPVAHAQNNVAEGAPAVGLSAAIAGTTVPYGAILTAQPSHSGPEGIAHIVSVRFYVNGNLASTATEAPWTASVTNLSFGSHHAYALATDDQGVVAMSAPVSFNPGDCDGDSLPSSWELQYGLDPTDAADASTDTDDDKLTNLQEFQYSTNPRDQDTDDDYVPDGTEVLAPHG